MFDWDVAKAKIRLISLVSAVPRRSTMIGPFVLLVIVPSG